MIDVKELRIGNWLCYKGEAVQVYSIDPEKQWPELGLSCSIGVMQFVGTHKMGTRGWWLNNFEPIPLTPDILTKHNIKFYEYDTDAFSMVFMKQGELLIGHFVKTARTEYFHQLQNLVFVLTGNELNYQP